MYLLGIEFKVITDCTAVRYTFEKRDLIPRIARWWLRIQEYRFTVEHKPGKNLAHVDALSRNSIASLTTLRIDSEDWFLAIQLQEDSIQQIVSQLASKKASDLFHDYKLQNNRLYRKTLQGYRLVIPKSAQFRLLQKYHDEIGHVGFVKCVEQLKPIIISLE